MSHAAHIRALVREAEQAYDDLCKTLADIERRHRQLVEQRHKKYTAHKIAHIKQFIANLTH